MVTWATSVLFNAGSCARFAIWRACCAASSSRKMQRRISSFAFDCRPMIRSRVWSNSDPSMCGSNGSVDTAGRRGARRQTTFDIHQPVVREESARQRATGCTLVCPGYRPLRPIDDGTAEFRHGGNVGINLWRGTWRYLAVRGGIRILDRARATPNCLKRPGRECNRHISADSSPG
jgi:hypothetical protein